MIKPFRTIVASAAVSATMMATAWAAGVDVNATSTGLALRGYDPVAYFTAGEPVRGNWKITTTHGDAIYRFSSEENKAKFEANPAAFAPAYGGYCAFGTAMGFKFDGDPSIWKIVDGKLYLNLGPGVQERWESEQADFIVSANTNWKTIADKAPEELQQ